MRNHQTRTFSNEGDIAVNLSAIEGRNNTMLLNSNEVTDELLVSAAQCGDSQAFVELSKRHSRRLLLKTYRITNNWQDAEDVVQDSFMKVFTHLHTFESRATFSTWLTRIAINSALMLLRKRRSSRTFPIDGLIQDEGLSDALELRDHRDNPEQRYARHQTEERLRKAIHRMRPKHREIVELRQVGDMSMNEIAQSLCISVPAVKSRLLRARSELRRHMR
jgi:RNA polymerase sigma-70 factor (ECF subfamily)